MTTKSRLDRLERQAAESSDNVCAVVVVWIHYGGGISGVLDQTDLAAIAQRGYLVKDSGVTVHGSRTIQVFHDNSPAAKLAAQTEVDDLLA